MRGILAIAVFFPSLVMGQSRAPLPNVLERASKATCWVRTERGFQATGWVISTDPPQIITCAHAIRDARVVDLVFRDPNLLNHMRDNYLEQLPALRRVGICCPATIVRTEPENDLALLSIAKLPAHVGALTLAPKPAPIGEPVFMVGHRADLDNLWTTATGWVRQRGTLQHGYYVQQKKVAVGQQALYLQIPAEPGDSGAAILNHSGEIVGMLSATLAQHEALAIALPRTLLAKFAEISLKDPPPQRQETIARTALLATVWVNPAFQEGRSSGVIIDRTHGLILTSAQATRGKNRLPVVFPAIEREAIRSEHSHYKDLIDLRVKKLCVDATVLAISEELDLAIIQVPAIPKECHELSLATKSPAPGDLIGTCSHPGGVEFMWLYAQGSTRGQAKVSLSSSGKSSSVDANLFQLPHQGGATGAGVFNNKGELCGILASKVAPRQQVAYAAQIERVNEWLKQQQNLLQPITAKEFTARIALHLQWHHDQLATIDCQRWLRAEPKNVAAFTQLGELLVRQQRWTELRTVLQNPPSGGERIARNLSVQMLITQGDTAKAKLLLMHFHEDDPARTWFSILLLGERWQRWALNEWLANHPKDRSARRLRIRTTYQFKSYEQFVAEDLDLLLQHPDPELEDFDLQAIWLEHQAEWNEANRIRQQIVEWQPENAEQRLLLARTWWEKGKAELCVQEMAHAVQLNAEKTPRMVRVFGEYLQLEMTKYPDRPEIPMKLVLLFDRLIVPHLGKKMQYSWQNILTNEQMKPTHRLRAIQRWIDKEVK
ncbi:MAG: serine protease [Zavarzinella sp.]